MLDLHATINDRWDADPLVARVREPHSQEIAADEVMLLREDSAALNGLAPTKRMAIPAPGEPDLKRRLIDLPAPLNYLTDGDIIRVIPRTAEIVTLYRRGSPHNSMLLTERCNSRCVMCSQPPKEALDGHLVDTYRKAIPLMDPGTEALGITGGEPTLLGDELLALIAQCKLQLPSTALHMLSNGRMFRYLSFARAIAATGHPNLMIGIPLYSDIASRHDFIVQARGAFDDTVRGIVNLLRCGVSVEVRVVLHRLTVNRLTNLAQFLARNLPSVDHVALMGLELMGYVKMNLDELWIEPPDYGPQLAAALQTLSAARVNVSIYNHPLCLLPRDVWLYARQSISDWKNDYPDVCDKCAVRDQCCGFFSSSKLRRSAHVRPFSAEDTTCAITPC